MCGQVTLLLLDERQIFGNRADVSAKRIAGLHPGIPVKAVLQNAQELSVTVRAIIPDENPRTRSRAVRFTADLPEGISQIAENQSVTLHIPVGTARQIISVHKDALLLDGGRPRVYVVRDGKVEVRPVSIGESLTSRFEVTGGLIKGEIVVIKGNKRLRPDASVSIQREE